MDMIIFETSNLIISGALIEIHRMGGGEAPHWDPFTILLYHSLKKSRKEMASLRENGQK